MFWRNSAFYIEMVTCKSVIRFTVIAGISKNVVCIIFFGGGNDYSFKLIDINARAADSKVL